MKLQRGFSDRHCRRQRVAATATIDGTTAANRDHRVIRKGQRARRIVTALAAVTAFVGVMFGATSAASASGIGDPYNPPTLTDGNDWYNGQQAASYAIATVDQPQPFDEACAWFVSNALWAGGLPEDNVWNENTTHGNIWSFAAGQGSPTAGDVTLLTQYLLTNYPASYLQQLDLSPNATSWPVSLGDVIIYVWDGDPNWLTDGDHNTHMALVTNIEPSGYPDVSEWGDVGENGISPDNPWRGWTWSALNNEWLQQEYPNMTAYVLHIDTSQPITF